MSRWSTTGRDRGAPTAVRSSGKLDRRQFCRLGALLGGGAVGALLAARSGLAIGPGRPDFGDLETLFRQHYPLDDPDAIVQSTCLGCHGACPVRVVTELGVIARCDGNPWSPRVHGGPAPVDPPQAPPRRGARSARGQARLQNTHDPYRLVRPLAREGRRGAGTWRSLDAASAIAALREAGAGADGAGLVVAVDPRQADRRSVLEEFGQALPAAQVHLGTPNPWVQEASEAMLGSVGWTISPRLDRARGALLWGADAVASGVDPVGDARDLMTLAERGGTSLIVVDPRLSEAAGLADLWLPVRPGGDAALAWMMLRAWMDDGAIDAPVAWQQQLQAQPWKDLERRSGLGESMVRRSAEQLWALGSGLAIRVGGGVGDRAGGADVTEAILRLAVLSGATDSGGAMEPSLAPTPLGDRADQGLRSLLADGGTIDHLLVVGDGGLVDCAGQSALLAALADPERVHHVTVVTPTMNPVAALADLVLPDVTEFERSGLVERWDGTSRVQPVIAPVPLESGLDAPLGRGLEGVLEDLATAAGASLDCEQVVIRAEEATGRASDLRQRGWIPRRSPEQGPPTADPFRPESVRSPGEPLAGLALVTYRESFGGFVDSSAQYWATPSLRARNELWIHPTTADEVEGAEDGRLTVSVGGRHQQVHVKATEGIRPGVVAAAVGYGHHEGYDGATTIDGETVLPDPRRTLGFDAGSLRDDREPLTTSPADREPRRTLAELLAAKPGSCDRL